MMIRKIIIVSLTVMLSALSFVKSTTFIYADDGVCDFDSDSYDANECKAYQEEQLANIEKEIEAAKSDMDAAQKLANEYGASIDELKKQIEELEPQIAELETKIAELEVEIKKSEEKVEVLKQRILKRMVSLQGTMHFNPYLDFILGSNGFADMLRRSYGVEAITSKEEKDRNELIDVLNKLNADKKLLDDAKAELDDKKAILESSKKNAEAMQVYYQQVVVDTYAQIQELMEEEASHQMVLSAIVFELDELLAWPRQTGFIHPVRNSSISAGIPAYPADFGGGMHIGIDYAASYGTNILAPADGVIVSSVNACENDTGYNLGDRCGFVEGKGMAAGGNQLRMIFSVNGVMYGLIAFHMLYGSVHAEGVVMAGTPIGQVGSSGNSTGAHCHIELFYLGKGEAKDIPTYLNKGYTVGFNLGYNLDSLCYNRGGAPCRLDGRDFFGIDPAELVW